MAMISVGLYARTAKFISGMNKSGKSVKRFGRATRSISKTVGMLGGIMAGVASVNMFKNMIKESFSAMDATAKLSNTINGTTEELTGLGYAAGIAGSDSATMMKSLGKMQKGIGEAGKGLGEARYALDAMGVSLTDLEGMTAGERFSFLADNVNNLATTEEKAFVATKLFGKSGMDLLNTMEMGSKGLDKMQQKAMELGISYSRVDASFIEEANDAMTNVGEVATGLFNKISIQLAPYITEFANSIVQAITDMGSAGFSLTDAFNGTVLTLAKIADWFALLKSLAYSLASIALRQFSSIAGAISNMFGTIIDTLAGAAEFLGFDSMADSLRGITDGARSAIEGMDTAADMLGEKAADSMVTFLDGANEEAALNFMDRIDAERAAREKAMAGKANKTAAGIDVPGAVEKAGKKTEFTQTSLQRIAFTGTVGMSTRKEKTKIESDQLSELIRLKKQEMRTAPVAVAG